MKKHTKVTALILISLTLSVVICIFSFFITSSNLLLLRLIQFYLAGFVISNVLIYVFFIKETTTDSVSQTVSTPAPQPQSQTLPILQIQPTELMITDNQMDKLKYEAILSYIGEGLVVIDKEGKIITFNKAAESLLGWAENEAIGKNLTDIIQFDYKSSIEASMMHGRSSALFFIRKDKTKFPAAITTTSYGHDKKILGTITLFRDVTVEQNIDKMKNEFISLASHQLRTPLSAIKWYTEMLLNGDAGKLLTAQQEYAQTIYTSTERMIDLVNLLLNITRIESGRIAVEPKPTDIKKMVDEIVQEVAIRYKDKQQTIKVIANEALPQINVDPRLIRQVYVNLLTNAAKYSPEKTEVTVTLSKNNTEILSEVKDNGVGIPEKDQDKVFGKFYRAGQLVTRENEGTGLGLYLVKDIVELSHGRIWFVSKEGKGTTFSFALPLTGTPPKEGVLTIEI